MLTIRDTNTTPREKRWFYPGVDGKEIASNSYMNLKREVAMHYRTNGREVPSDEEFTKYLCDNLSVPCFDGAATYRNAFTDPVSYAKRGLPSPKWPFILEPLKLLAKEGDRGLGDIVSRVVGDIGGETYKAWHLKIFGKPCGCSERQDDLNRDFPL